MENAIRKDVLDFAAELIEELASEIDLHYDDNELKEAGGGIARLEKLQSLVGEPGETYLHIVKRYRAATSLGESDA
jgi:hypothetical protein